MKVAITGHTSGIGKVLAGYFTNRGDEVIGFSRSTGHVLPRDWKKIVEEANDCDIFVNNARPYKGRDLSQVSILTQLAQNWKGQEKKIIVIGSISGRFVTPSMPIYIAQKAALQKTVALFQSSDILPRIFLINFGKIWTPRSSEDKGWMMPMSSIVKVIDFYLYFPHDILDITFRHEKALCEIA
jgi:NAD(P)-dependent dehydrogenase (short-subunit alcohol dehydrogenase family)